MAISLKQSGANSATFLVSGVTSGSVTTASFDEAPAGQLKTFVETAFTSAADMYTEWARIGGVYSISGSAAGGDLRIYRNEDNTPVFGVATISDTATYVLRIQTRYSASE